MITRTAPLLFALFGASAALAQVAPVPPEQCEDFPPGDDQSGGGAPPAPGEGEGEREADAVIDPGFFGNIFVVSPPPNIVNTPRNIEIRLGGDVNSLDFDPPAFVVELRDPTGARVPLVRDGSSVRLESPLAPQTTFLIHIEPTLAHPCPECFGTQELSFATGDDIDLVAPELTGTPPVNVFVLPNAEQAAACGLFFSQTHQVVIDFGPTFPINTFISIVGRTDGGDPLNLFETFNTGQAFPVVTDLGRELPVALGDSFFIAVTPRDLAGNIGAARVVRTRARNFVDQLKPRSELAPLWCDMPTEAVVTAPPELPRNGRIIVDFPFEEIPLALRADDGEMFPLVPVDDTDDGHVYNTALPLPPNTTLEVTGLDCPHCVCRGCTSFSGKRVFVGGAIDTSPPAPAVVREIREDADPALAVEGECRPDRPALVVVLEPGRDDNALPLDLRYDVSIRIEDGPQLALARSVVPLVRADGAPVLRIETGLGRVLGERFELTLEAIDSAGNRTPSTTKHGEEPQTGCASTSPSGSFAALLVALALVRRRTPGTSPGSTR